MPLVQSQVTQFIGKPPSKGVNPDEAVAIGAAMMAHSLAGVGTGTEGLTLLDVLPMPIGINKTDGSMHVLFKKNQPLPDYKTRTLTTSKENQRSIMLRLYQGESKYCEDNERLGTFVFSGIRKAPRGKVQIEVTFHIDSEGILGLTARDKATGQTVESQLKLGKGGRGSRKKRKKRQEAKPKPQQAAPAPLTMPTSGLAEQLAADKAVPISKPAPKTEGKGAATAELSPKRDEKKGFWAWLKGLIGLS